MAGGKSQNLGGGGAAGDTAETCTLTVVERRLVPSVALIVIVYSPAVLLLHVRVLVPEDWMPVGLRLHEMPSGVATESLTTPVNPLLGVTTILVVPGLPASRLMEPGLANTTKSGMPARVTRITTVVVCERDLLVPITVTV